MNFDKTLTKDMIERGYKQGIVRLTTDTEFYEYAEPAADGESGVVCAIGDCWLYFGGEEAESSTVAEYKNNFSEETIIENIYNTILALAEDWDLNGDECLYYYTYLKEHLTPVPKDTASLTLKFEVKRTRPSVTQGFVNVYCNGENIVTFGDEIVQIKNGDTYYGELISGWASKTPDMSFIRSTLFHPHDGIYHVSDGVRKIINAEIEREKANNPRKSNSSWRFDNEDDCFVCPECGTYALRDWAGASTESNYCPACGKRLHKWDGKTFQ